MKPNIFKIYETTEVLTVYPLSVVHTQKYVEKIESGALTVDRVSC